MDGGSSEARKHEAPTYERQDHRAPKRCRGESHGILLQQDSDDYYDAEADEDDVRTEVTTGDGKTHKNTLPAKSTVLVLKQHLAHDAGFTPQQTRMFVNGDSREEELEEEEGLGSLRRGKGLAVLITMTVEEADAQEVVPRLASKADLVLGDGTTGNGDDQLNNPRGVAFVPAHPNWVVTTECDGHCIKLSNICTGALICKFGQRGSGEGQFINPYGVAVTSDSSFVIVADYSNHRMKVLRLAVTADGGSAHLEFVRTRVRHIGNPIGAFNYPNGEGSGEGQLSYPIGVALLPGEGGGQETVLVTDRNNHRVSQFKLNGTFIRIFAGTGTRGSGDGEFSRPYGITVLGSSGEVAVTGFDNHRVQIFDSEGKYKRQFGSEGKEADGQFFGPTSLASDVHGNLLVLDYTNRLQVFSPEGKHLCTRNDMGLKAESIKGIAWSDVGELAIANGNGNQALVWRKE
jgi:DNA-binding beta-propeller fold protein YncE